MGKSQDLFFKVFSQHSLLALDLDDPALQPQEQAVGLSFLSFKKSLPETAPEGVAFASKEQPYEPEEVLQDQTHPGYTCRACHG